MPANDYPASSCTSTPTRPLNLQSATKPGMHREGWDDTPQKDDGGSSRREAKATLAPTSSQAPLCKSHVTTQTNGQEGSSKDHQAASVLFSTTRGS